MVMSIQLSGLSFCYSAEDTPLFKNVNLTIPRKKIGVVGPNGCGKSTLLSLLTGELLPSIGHVKLDDDFDVLTQSRESYLNQNIADIFGIGMQWEALKRIREGGISQQDYDLVGDAWLLDETIKQGLAEVQLHHVGLETRFDQLSGGEQTKVLLAKLFYRPNTFLFLDEPSNHLDSTTKLLLFRKIKQSAQPCLIISHDRALLNLMDMIIEIKKQSLFVYGGNYDDYKRQKEVEESAIEANIQSDRMKLKKAEQQFQTRRERHAQASSKGRQIRKTMVKKFGFVKDKMALDSKKGRNEKTNKRVLEQGRRLTAKLSHSLQDNQSKRDVRESLKIQMPETAIPRHKQVLSVNNLSFSYGEKPLITDFSFEVFGAERIALLGDNGTGKTTLLKCLAGELKPERGEVCVHVAKARLSQADLIRANELVTVVDYFLSIHTDVSIQSAHDTLAQFLFRGEQSLLNVNSLSGGEMLRLKLAVLLGGNHPPQCLFLDEPTNHLDIDSVEILEEALAAYQGALVVISHDTTFLKNINMTRELTAPFKSV